MVKQNRKKKIELSEMKKLIDALLGEMREVKRVLYDIEAGLNATPPQATMPSSPTDITMETSKQVEAVVEPVTIHPVIEPPVESQPVADVTEEPPSTDLKPEDHKPDGIF